MLIDVLKCYQAQGWDQRTPYDTPEEGYLITLNQWVQDSTHKDGPQKIEYEKVRDQFVTI